MRFGAWVLAPLQGAAASLGAGAAAECCRRVLLGGGRVCFGTWLLVPVQSAAAGCCCRVLLPDYGGVRFGACWCRCRVPPLWCCSQSTLAFFIGVYVAVMEVKARQGPKGF